MVKTLIALRHMCVKEFGVGFRDYEESDRDHSSGFVVKWMRISRR